jgi:hypothetical protein
MAKRTKSSTALGKILGQVILVGGGPDPRKDLFPNAHKSTMAGVRQDLPPSCPTGRALLLQHALKAQLFLLTTGEPDDIVTACGLAMGLVKGQRAATLVGVRWRDVHFAPGSTGKNDILSPDVGGTVFLMGQKAPGSAPRCGERCILSPEGHSAEDMWELRLANPFWVMALQLTVLKASLQWEGTLLELKDCLADCPVLCEVRRLGGVPLPAVPLSTAMFSRRIHAAVAGSCGEDAADGITSKSLRSGLAGRVVELAMGALGGQDWPVSAGPLLAKLGTWRYDQSPGGNVVDEHYMRGVAEARLDLWTVAVGARGTGRPARSYHDVYSEAVADAGANCHPPRRTAAP